ncbi:MAG TPA: hypothetical protein VFE98_09625 [Candidatus Bathyarchaeia archaeon]|nr:hypothetical protein [Candidatus Bathyarchaeia archaeon]
MSYQSKDNRDRKASNAASDTFVDLFRHVVVEKRKETVKTHG